MRRSFSRRRGFTLTELMITVVIVGILATVAVVGYRKLVNSSHVSEATHMVGAIKMAQESFRAETGQFANISADLNRGKLYPVASPSSGVKTAWGGTCAACIDPNGWLRLPVHADGPVQFGYATVAGVANAGIGATAPTMNGAAITWPTPAQLTSDWYLVSAVADLAGNGSDTIVLGSSFQKDLLVSE